MAPHYKHASLVRLQSAQAQIDWVTVARKFRRCFPALAQRPLAESRVCQYENTDNGNLLIDRHPAWDNTWIVGGGSGHGFKHGPAVGHYVTDLVLGTGKAEPRFAINSHRIHGSELST